MNPWGNVVRVYDRYGTPHVRTLGTSDLTQIPELKAFVRWLRTKRKWDALDLIIARALSISDAYDAHEAGELADVVARLKAAQQDVDLEPLVTEWAERANAKYVKQVRTLIIAGKPFPASRFSRSEVSRFLAGLKVADPTRNRYRAALSVFARWLVEREVLDFNPVRDVRGFKERDPRDKWLDPFDAERLVYAAHMPYRAIFALLYYSGVEIGAALKLTASDLGTDGTVHVRGAKTRWRNRIIRVPTWVWELLPRAMPGRPLFPGITYDMVYDAHKAALEALGLSGYTMHDARHSYAVNALRRGLSPQVVAHQLGHRDASMVLRVYGRFIPQAEDYEPKVAPKRRNRRA
jgi:integrase